MTPQRRLFFPLVLLLAFWLSGCAAKKPSDGGYSGPPCQDVLSMPQDLNMYAYDYGVNEALAAPHEQAEAAARQKQAFYRPWRASAPSRWVREALEKDFNMRPGKAFTRDKKPFSTELWNSLVENSNKAAYGTRHWRGITLRHSNLRAMPTKEHFYRNPDLPGEGYPFDYFQHSSLHAGVPVHVSNVSKDGKWLLAESAVTSGWIPSEDVAEIDEDFARRWEEPPLAALVRDNTPIAGSNNHIGALLPLAGNAPPGRGLELSVFFPRRGSEGKAEISVEVLPRDAATAIPLNMTPGEVAKIGNEMMGQPYGWGGLDEKRDCSALTRDLMAPFGYFLPRNSASQSKVGAVVNLAGLEPEEKERAIIREAKPFASLIWFRGHIGLYAGQYNGKPVMFHNMWGLRTQGAANDCTGRAVVGKAVVTTLRPGEERPDLCPQGRFLPRIEKAAVLTSPAPALMDAAVKKAPPPAKTAKAKAPKTGAKQGGQKRAAKSGKKIQGEKR